MSVDPATVRVGRGAWYRTDADPLADLQRYHAYLGSQECREAEWEAEAYYREHVIRPVVDEMFRRYALRRRYPHAAHGYRRRYVRNHRRRRP